MDSTLKELPCLRVQGVLQRIEQRVKHFSTSQFHRRLRMQHWSSAREENLATDWRVQQLGLDHLNLDLFITFVGSAQFNFMEINYY